jgi:hypothetical protein
LFSLPIKLYFYSILLFWVPPIRFNVSSISWYQSHIIGMSFNTYVVYLSFHLRSWLFWFDSRNLFCFLLISFSFQLSIALMQKSSARKLFQKSLFLADFYIEDLKFVLTIFLIKNWILLFQLAQLLKFTWTLPLCVYLNTDNSLLFFNRSLPVNSVYLVYRKMVGSIDENIH